jgi:poly [ADP-ribose] polymerase
MAEVRPSAHLVMVTKDNNNKYYDMADNGDGNFTATWGRIGVTAESQVYPIGKWGSKLREKTKKGYVDQSHLFIKPKKGDSSLITISNKDVSALVTLLQQYANKSVSENYTVDASTVTQAQVDAAQALINDISKFVNKRSLDAEEINDALLKLYGVIPRRMGNVKNYILPVNKTTPATVLRNTLQQYISSEQDTLDVMAGQVSTITTTTQTVDDKKNILDVIGLQLEIVDTADKEYSMIKKMMGPDASKLVSAYRLSSKKTEEPYVKNLAQAKNKSTEMYWHGSRNENWWSILQSGLLVRPSNAVISGKMFGYGIYGADKFQKSYGYTSGRGSYWANGSQAVAFLGIYEFHMGNRFTVKKYDGSLCGNMDYKKLRAQGDYDSLEAMGGYDLRNNEFIVYQEKQLTVRYLVKVQA